MKVTLCYFPPLDDVEHEMKSLLVSLCFFASLPSLSLPARAQSITISGTMHRSTLEGGCWYLQSDINRSNDREGSMDRGSSGGKRYELVGDTGIVYPLRIEGQHIVINAEPVKNAASVCMMGEIVRVLQRIDTVRYPIDLPIMAILLDGTVHRTKSGVWYVKTSHGREYEFQQPPARPYRHSGARIHKKFRVLLDKNSTKTGKDGVILPESTQPAKPIMKQKTYDAR